VLALERLCRAAPPRTRDALAADESVMEALVDVYNNAHKDSDEVVVMECRNLLNKLM
jgi:hypothetical protein